METKELPQGTNFKDLTHGHYFIPLPPVRTISEIIIDADNHSDDLSYLFKLWEEVRFNLKGYPIVELEYIHEHLQELAGNLGRKDAELLKNLLNLFA